MATENTLKPFLARKDAKGREGQLCLNQDLRD